MTVTFSINGTTFDYYGIIVMQSKGIINALKVREITRQVWPEHHGEVIDLVYPRYESRDIVLECLLKADNSTEFLTAVNSFITDIRQSGLQQLVIKVDDGAITLKPLVYMVYLQEMPDITKTWSEANMFGTFSLKLREPEPVKRVYQPTASSVSITVTSDDPVNIYWGDGGIDYDVTTATGAVTHSYSSYEYYYVVITGIIENISATATGATVIWDRLQ